MKMMRLRNPSPRMKCVEVLDQLLAGGVHRVRLAREDDLDRPLRVVQQFPQAVRVLEEERAALVLREPPREADRERLRVEELLGLVHDVGRRAAAQRLLAQPLAGEPDEPLAPALVRAPELGVGDGLDALPDREVHRLLEEPRPEVAVEQFASCRGSARSACGCRW